ncbi:MAG: hypothetical protein RIT45_4386 [Pseudomonadota bacterium]|jgi:hypothetical protein
MRPTPLIPLVTSDFDPTEVAVPWRVETEMREAVGADGAFVRGPLLARYAAPFTVRDGNLLTARWPGDARGFAEAFVAMIEAAAGVTGAATAPEAS